jgi:hypothetical protein
MLSRECTLVKAKNYAEVTDPVKCGPSLSHNFTWTIIAVDGDWFIVECGKHKTQMKVNQVWVNSKDIE